MCIKCIPWRHSRKVRWFYGRNLQCSRAMRPAYDSLQWITVSASWRRRRPVVCSCTRRPLGAIMSGSAGERVACVPQKKPLMQNVYQLSWLMRAKPPCQCGNQACSVALLEWRTTSWCPWKTWGEFSTGRSFCVKRG